MSNRIFLIGSGGSGKTTIARKLASNLDTESYELDNLFWNDGWKPSTDDEFLRRVSSIISKPNWVIDGNYRGKIFDAVYESSNLIIWLKLPRSIAIWRCFLRSVRMLLMKQNFYNKELPVSLWGCIKHLKFTWVTYYERNQYLDQRVEEYARSGKTVIVLETQSEIDLYLKNAIKI